MKFVLSTRSNLYSASFNLNEQGYDEVRYEETPLILPSPYDVDDSFGADLVGSCNGLLCLLLRETFLLWNPTTRTHHVFPHPPHGLERERKGLHDDVHGLGYDENKDDFKFVIVYQFLGHENGIRSIDPEVWVYSLESDSWKKIDLDGFSHHLRFDREVTDVFVNGSLHYIVNKKTKSSDEMENDIIDSEDLIGAFVISEEIFELIPKPASVESDKEFELGLGVSDWRLSMLVTENNARRFRLLEMQEYGNSSSWIELFRFERDAALPIGMRHVVTTVVRNQRFVLLEGGQKVFAFHVEINSFRGFFPHGLELIEVCVFMETERRLDTEDEVESSRR